MSLIASLDSSIVSQTVTPLPAARPSALTTRGWLNLLRISSASSLDFADQ